MSEGLLASELFGHEAGAFTGAVSRRRGLFEQAHGGTLFLDEIGEMDPKLQAHLLRVLQEGTFRRVGGEKLVRTDARVIAATHRPIRQRVEDGTFRQDLFYRLSGATLQVPALRDRPDDIPALIGLFLKEARAQHKRVTRQALQRLQQHDWPGNVRELRAEVVRWALFAGDTIDERDLSIDPPVSNSIARSHDLPEFDEVQPLEDRVRETEHQAILHAFKAFRGNISQTARALSIDRNTLKKKLRAYQIGPT